jgi:tellurite resistance protein TehA-like permease
MRWPARAARALSEGAFAVVMATAIVSRATHAEAPAISDVLLWIAVAALIALSALTPVRPRPRGSRAGWWDAVTFAAAAGAVAAGLSARSHAGAAHALDVAAHALDVAAISVWLVAIARPAPWTAAGGRRRGDEASGRRLLVVVATQSAVIAAAALDRWAGSSLLAGAAVAAWAAALALHVPIARPVARGLLLRGQRGRFRADDWVLMGVLAISALAASALLRMPAVPAREGVRILGIAGWAGACLWIPFLARIDVARALAGRPGWPGAERWGMVFPFGMFAAASQALGTATGHPLIHRIGLGATWIAVIAWAAVAAGIVGGAVAGRVRPRAARIGGRQLPE